LTLGAGKKESELSKGEKERREYGTQAQKYCSRKGGIVHLRGGG